MFTHVLLLMGGLYYKYQLANFPATGPVTLDTVFAALNNDTHPYPRSLSVGDIIIEATPGQGTVFWRVEDKGWTPLFNPALPYAMRPTGYVPTPEELTLDPFNREDLNRLRELGANL